MKIIKALVDKEGNVRVDLAGYVGEECAPVEEAFRRALLELGLSTRIQFLRRKDPDPASPTLSSRLQEKLYAA